MLNEEYAEALLDAKGDSDEPDPEWSPDLTEWSLTNQLLMQLTDQMQILTGAVIGSAGGKPPKMQPAPRPKTAFQLVEERKQKETHDMFVGMLTPDLL